MGTTTIRMALATGLAVGASALGVGGASAMPSLDHSLPTAAVAARNIEQARWVCGPYRCWRRSGHYWSPYRGGGYYGRPYQWGYGGYGGYGYGPYVYGGNGWEGYRNPCD